MDSGGTLGLFAGMSLLSGIEAFVWIFGWINQLFVNLFRKTKNLILLNIAAVLQICFFALVHPLYKALQF